MRAAAAERSCRLCRRRGAEMAGVARRPLTAFSAKRGRVRAARISKPSAPSAARCCRALPASRCCGIVSRRRGGNGRSEWQQPDDAEMRGAARRPGQATRSSSSNSCNGSPTASCAPAKELADRLGMKVGLYLDVAVGVQSDGFDAWNEQVAISRHLARRRAARSAQHASGRTGASPASMPPASRCKSFEPFRDMLRASMRHAGAIRLDHVLGLKRLYLVPHGFPARQRRLCADAARGAAGRDRAGERRATIAS